MSTTSRSITEKAATRIRERRERKVSYHYSSRHGTEVFSANTREWKHSPVRVDVEQGGDDDLRIVPTDSSTVHLFIEAIRRSGR